ncbi:MAG: FHA domain-containing protein [Hyphomicrobiaceae bacterium]|nr:FHA domain-containing protein [Hyphomicrobiaceae bacterium]
MAKPAKPGEPATQIIPADRGQRAPADMDNMMTTVRSVRVGRLIVTDGPGKGQSIEFYQGSNSIGRDATKNVVAIDFGDAAIHREHHAYLTCNKGVCTLSDNGKQNPIKVNGRMLEGETKVGPGDEIMLGVTKLRIELG